MKGDGRERASFNESVSFFAERISRQKGKDFRKHILSYFFFLFFFFYFIFSPFYFFCYFFCLLVIMNEKSSFFRVFGALLYVKCVFFSLMASFSCSKFSVFCGLVCSGVLLPVCVEGVHSSTCQSMLEVY